MPDLGLGERVARIEERTEEHGRQLGAIFSNLDIVAKANAQTAVHLASMAANQEQHHMQLQKHQSCMDRLDQAYWGGRGLWVALAGAVAVGGGIVGIVAFFVGR